MTDNQSHNPERVAHPELWHLDMALRRDAIDYILYTPSHDDSLQSGHIALDTAAGDYLKAVENAVYDHPVLLDDYGRVRLLADSHHFILLPPEVSDEDDIDALLRVAYPDAEGDASLCHLRQCGVSIVSELPRGVPGFVQRTFNNPPVYHHLMPLCEHYEHLNAHATIARMFLNLSSDSMDMVIYRGGRIAIANSYRFRSVDDAAYFVLAAYESAAMDRMTDEIQLTGDRALREKLTPLLRRYIHYVMPAIYPAAAMRIGHDAMKAPFDLIMLALCE